MNQIFQINLDQNDDIQDYEKNESNLMHLSIQLPDGKIVSGNGCRVQVAISADGMLGLGTELIRKAMRLKRSQTAEMQEGEQYTCQL